MYTYIRILPCCDLKVFFTQFAHFFRLPSNLFPLRPAHLFLIPATFRRRRPLIRWVVCSLAGGHLVGAVISCIRSVSADKLASWIVHVCMWYIYMQDISLYNTWYYMGCVCVCTVCGCVLYVYALSAQSIPLPLQYWNGNQYSLERERE